MSDTEILNWLDEHLEFYRYGFQYDESGNRLNVMGWINGAGYSHHTNGLNLRDCVEKAKKIQEN
jgi:hypothetical protein